MNTRGRDEDAGVLAGDQRSGRNGDSSGANNCGRELAKKNTEQRPEIEQRASGRGESWGFAGFRAVMSVPRLSSSARRCP